jgi:hypothetical protein
MSMFVFRIGKIGLARRAGIRLASFIRNVSNCLHKLEEAGVTITTARTSDFSPTTEHKLAR